MKTCNCCGSDKPATIEFFVKGRRGGIGPRCRSCRNQRLREQRAASPDRYRATNAAWNKANAERVRATTAAWASANRAKRTQQQAAWYAANRDKANKRSREWKRRKSRTDPKYRLNSSISRQTRQSLAEGKAGRSWEALLGYTLADLQRHLERQFLRGMSWDNYGDWHVDHILPVSMFQFESADDPQFRACWALTNLRPLWAGENLSKNDARLHLI